MMGTYTPRPGDAVVHVNTGRVAKVVSVLRNARKEWTGVRVRFYREQYPQTLLPFEFREARILEQVVNRFRRLFQP